MPGQEGIPSVFSPMARTLEDLVYFSRSLVSLFGALLNLFLDLFQGYKACRRSVRLKGQAVQLNA